METFEKMSDKEIAKFVQDKREEVRAFRFGTGGRNVSSVSTAKRDIARALTVLNSRAKAESK